MRTREGGHVATRLTIAMMDSLDMADMSVSGCAAQRTLINTFGLALEMMEAIVYKAFVILVRYL